MLYSSRNGCLFYYDSILFRWNIAEPSMLFILGLDSILSHKKSNSDSISVFRYAYNKSTNSTELLEHIDEIYDSIYMFLSNIGTVEDLENYIRCNCYGLKLLLNSFTGIDDDKIIPVIFKSDVNKSLIDPTRQMFRMPESVKLTKSTHTILAQQIKNIFLDADYDIDNTIDDTIIINDSNKPIRKDIQHYNSMVLSVHNERLSNSNAFRLLDYKSMYSYALGVLYGCKCLGYLDEAIWRFPPRMWYAGTLNNLVETAWYTFNFHWTHHIENSEYSIYHDIQDNQIWNFTNTFEPQSSEYTTPSIANDETGCYCVYLDSQNKTVSEYIIYSKNTTTALDSTYPGSYINFKNTEDLQCEWRPISEKISSDGTLKGIVSERDLYVTRYIGNNTVSIYRAYSYISDGNKEYLAPKQDGLYKNFYVLTGNLGWVNYDTNNVYDPSMRMLSVVKKQPVMSDLVRCGIRNNDGSISIAYYYKCHVTADTCLYGIYKSKVSENLVPYNFDTIISSNVFDSTIIESVPSDEYYSKQYYNLSTQVWLFTKSVGGKDYVWDGDDSLDDKPTGYYGYSSVPSSEITLYTVTGDNRLQSLEYRVLPSGLIWSSSFPELEWHSKESVTHTSLYLLRDKTIDLYKGENIILSSEKTYLNYISDDDLIFIFMNDSLYYHNLYSMVPVKADNNSLYQIGITTNLCSFIYEDDFGNSLLDEDGNPLVWHDPKYNLYWNGLFCINRWQVDKPRMYNAIMYDSTLKQEIHIYNDSYNRTVSIDGVGIVTYEEFYSHPNYGIIEQTVSVFNPSVSDSIIDCYCDNNTDNDLYCIPGISESWVTRQSISDSGYRFVDGTSSLYDGDIQEDLVYDDNPVD